MRTEIITVDPRHPQTNALKEAARIIIGGGVIAFPTDTTYGLGANPFNDGAVERIFELKGRQAEKPILILIDHPQQLKELVQGISHSAQELMDKFWPGPLTLIFSASHSLREHVIARSGKIGVRLPDSQIARRLVQEAGVPVTATSANISGKQSALDVNNVCTYFGDRLDLILDAGQAVQAIESTVIDVTCEVPVVVRQGAITV